MWYRFCRHCNNLILESVWVINMKIYVDEPTVIYYKAMILNFNTDFIFRLLIWFFSWKLWCFTSCFVNLSIIVVRRGRRTTKIIGHCLICNSVKIIFIDCIINVDFAIVVMYKNIKLISLCLKLKRIRLILKQEKYISRRERERQREWRTWLTYYVCL